MNAPSSSSPHSSPSFLPSSLRQELAVAMVCVDNGAENVFHRGQVAHCQASQAGTAAAWYLHRALPYPYAFRLAGGWLGYFPPPESRYLDKCDALCTEIKCCVYKSKRVVNFDLLFLKEKKGFIST